MCSSDLYVTAGTGVAINDGGSGSFFQMSLTGAALSLNNAAGGIIVKDSASTVAARQIVTTGAGLSISNGNGTGGNPTLALSGLPATLANLTGSGMLAIVNGATVNSRVITGTTNQIDVVNGNGQSGNPTIAISDNPVLSGTGAVKIPVGNNTEKPTGADGEIRYNSDVPGYEGDRKSVV